MSIIFLVSYFQVVPMRLNACREQIWSFVVVWSWEKRPENWEKKQEMGRSHMLGTSWSWSKPSCLSAKAWNGGHGEGTDTGMWHSGSQPCPPCHIIYSLIFTFYMLSFEFWKSLLKLFSGRLAQFAALFSLLLEYHEFQNFLDFMYFSLSWM